MGEFTVDHMGEEKLEGFIIRTFSVVHKKVHSMALYTVCDDCPDSLVKATRCINYT